MPIQRLSSARATCYSPPLAKKRNSEDHAGWDEYAPFYDWENAQTLGRRDVPFWRSAALAADGPVLELGCGTGRIVAPLARAGVHLVGIDRSFPMLALARRRIARARLSPRVRLIRGDIRAVPCPDSAFAMVMAPYGVLQSLLRERDLAATLGSVRRVLRRGGTFGVELVADLPSWGEYQRRVSLKGWRHRPGGAHLTLVETVRQDRAKHLTIFDQDFTERRGQQRRSRRFSLTFRTLSVPQMARRLEKAGFEITALHGDYEGGPWHSGAEVWIILGRRR